MREYPRRWLAVLLVVCAPLILSAADLPRLRVHEEGRYLVFEDGRPFFYLGDTAWELFHRLTREEAAEYLDDRAANGFTVIQAVALAELDGLNTPNAYGHRPLIEEDPARPDVRDGPKNDYWDHVDAVIDLAAERGLYVGLLPTWGDKWYKRWGVGPEIFTPENARIFGEWIGRRYRDKPVIWIMGGDRNIVEDIHRAIIEAMAAGVRSGDGGRNLMTFHPQGGRGSSTWFHDAEWLDFNLRQNGHAVDFKGYVRTREDYDRTPVKPVIDGEPLYEDHPIAFAAPEHGHSIAADVRRPLYWDLFSGACGHTYGHHSIWQFHDASRGSGVNMPLVTWREALRQPGGRQMQHGRALIESRPMLTRIPDDHMIVPAEGAPTAVPGAGRHRIVATRDRDGSYAMIYTPSGRAFTLRLDALSGNEIQAWWFNPRTGEAKKAERFRREATRRFISPNPGEYLDWVLVLDDASKGYPPPGTGR